MIIPTQLKKKIVIGKYSSRRFLGTEDCIKFVPILSFVHTMINNDLLPLCIGVGLASQIILGTRLSFHYLFFFFF